MPLYHDEADAYNHSAYISSQGRSAKTYARDLMVNHLRRDHGYKLKQLKEMFHLEHRELKAILNRPIEDIY